MKTSDQFFPGDYPTLSREMLLALEYVMCLPMDAKGLIVKDLVHKLVYDNDRKRIEKVLEFKLEDIETVGRDAQWDSLSHEQKLTAMSFSMNKIKDTLITSIPSPFSPNSSFHILPTSPH